MNKFYGQIRGPFTAGEDIFAKIKVKMGGTSNYLSTLGIQAFCGKLVNINGNQFEIGPAEMLDFEDINVTSLSFVDDVGEDTIIDFTYI